MTPAASLLQPDSNPALYVSSVLTLYVDLPDTPLRASASDQWLARRFHDDGVPLRVVETALLLASLRRLIRPTDAPRRCTSTVSDPLAGLFPTGRRRTPRSSSAGKLPRLPPPQAPPSCRGPPGEHPKIYVF